MDETVLIGLAAAVLPVLTFFAGVKRGEIRERTREAKQQARVVRRYVTLAGKALPDLVSRLERLDKLSNTVPHRRTYFETEASLLSTADLAALSGVTEGAALLDQACSDCWNRVANAMQALHAEHERFRGLVSLAGRVRDFDNVAAYRDKLITARQELANGLRFCSKYGDIDSRPMIKNLLDEDTQNGTLRPPRVQGAE